MYDERGSVWRKWDLQVQPIKQQWFNDIEGSREAISAAADSYLNEAVNKNIDVIAITDHNSGAAIDSIIENDLDVQVLAGVELDLQEGWHLLVILNPAYKQKIGVATWEDTINDFLLNKCGIQRPFHNEGGVAKKVQVTTKALIKRIFIDDLGMPIFAHCCSGDGFFQRGNRQSRKEVLELFQENKARFVFEIKEDHSQIDYIKTQFENLVDEKLKIPIISSSDAHQSQDVGSCFTWIKADPTYEGVKQILFEPEIRVRIQEEDPITTDKKIHMSEISISDKSNYPIVNQNIKLNRDLVCIIGGRGSGKSALFETVAYCFNKHRSQVSTDDTGYQSSSSYGSDSFIDYYLKEDSDFDIKLDFISLDGEPLESYETNFQNKQENCSYPILYLGQNRIEYFANDAERIHQLAYDTVLKNTSRSDELNSAEKKINENKDELINLNKEIEGLNRKISDFDEDELTEEKKRIESERELLTSKEVKEFVQSFNVARKKREALKKLENLIGPINSEAETESGKLPNLVTSFQEEILETIDQVNQLLKEIGTEDISIELDLDPFLQQIEEVKEEIPKENITSEYQELLSEVEEKLEGKTDLSVSYLESLRSKEETLEEKLSNLEELQEELSQRKEDRYSLLNELNELYSSYNEQYQIAIQEFAEKNEGILQSVKLEAKKEFDLEKLVKRLFKEVDRRKVKDINRFKTDFLVIDDNDSFEFVDWIKEFLEDETNLDVFTDQSVEHFEELVFEDYYNLVTNIEYQISDEEYKPLYRLSLGQKGTVLLKFYLSSGNNCPILIDQPEDHLDNDFIYSDLVETIRRAKHKRQILIVTHDANLVVNGDAEQVIVARYQDEKIDHKQSGGLENPKIREAVARILEGGDEAFKRREKKYNFQ